MHLNCFLYFSNSGTGVGVLLTDGYSNDPALTWEQARIARETGIDMLAIGIG